LIQLCVMDSLLLVNTHSTVIPSMSGLLYYTWLGYINRFLIASTTSVIGSRALTNNWYVMRLFSAMRLCRPWHWFYFCLSGCGLGVVQQYYIIIKVLYSDIILMSTIIIVRSWYKIWGVWVILSLSQIRV